MEGSARDPNGDEFVTNAVAGEKPAAQPEGDVDEADQDRHLDQRADHCGEGDAGFHAEHRDGHGDGELEVVSRSSEGERRRARIVGTDALGQEEAREEHDGEIDRERDGDAHDIQRQRDDGISLEGEHHDDGEKQRGERELRDARDEFFIIPSLALQRDQDHAAEDSGGKRDAKIDHHAPENLRHRDRARLFLPARNRAEAR